MEEREIYRHIVGLMESMQAQGEIQIMHLKLVLGKIDVLQSQITMNARLAKIPECEEKQQFESDLKSLVDKVSDTTAADALIARIETMHEHHQALLVTMRGIVGSD